MNEKSLLSLARDFLGILVLGVTLFALIAIVSHNPRDPSFNSFSTVNSPPVRNQGGIVGAYIADALVQAFGSGAFFFPLVTLIIGWALIRAGEFQRWPLLLAAGLLLLLDMCAMLFIYRHADPFFGSVTSSGGVTGAFLGKIMALWLNTTGAKVAGWTFLCIAAIALTGATVNSLIETSGKIIKQTLLVILNSLMKINILINDWMKNYKAYREEQRKLDEEMEREVEHEMEKRVAPSEPVIVSRNAEKREPTSADERPKKARKEKFALQETLPFMGELGSYQIPPLSMLDDPPPPSDPKRAKDGILIRIATLEKKLRDFGVEGRVVQVLPGPVITLYEFEPASGIKVSRILALTDDLALAMCSASVRILAPVPGKAVVGIEIPNLKREIVYFKEVMSSEAFANVESKLAMALGKDSIGEPMVMDLAQIPHLLIAGATGSGKSVGINALICSILLNASPDEVKMIMIDPKMLELSMYDGIPHLIAPVVVNPKKATAALQWAVKEMERRYKAMAEKGVRNISGYNRLMEQLQKEYEAKNKKSGVKSKPRLEPAEGDFLEPSEMENEAPKSPPAKLPYIVIIIDELADLMMVASKGVEESLMRLAQMARAAGIHLILATQRPSVDVLTGVIKANFPARISFQVTSRVDSRTILDSIGAEKLLGKGDMLFMPPSTSRLQRVHGVMVSDAEINGILKFIREQGQPDYNAEIFLAPEIEELDEAGDEEMDEKYDEALALVAREQQASISMIQRKLRVGYNRAARMIEIMEKEGVVGPSDGVKPRAVYVKDIPIDR